MCALLWLGSLAGCTAPIFVDGADAQLAGDGSAPDGSDEAAADNDAGLDAGSQAPLGADSSARLDAASEAALDADNSARLDAASEAALDADSSARLDAENEASLDADSSARPDADSQAPLDSSADADAASPTDATTSNDAGPLLDANNGAPDAGNTDAALDAAQRDAGPVTQKLTLAADEDDTVWIVSGGRLSERLHFTALQDGSDGDTVEVSTDQDQNRVGLRFRLPLERGTRVLAAVLALKRAGSMTIMPTDTMRVLLYDNDNVGPFDPSHAHTTPAEHASGGFWEQSIGGFAAGNPGEVVTSKDLSPLVQHMIDRPGFQRDAYLGFVLAPDQMAPNTYVEFADFVTGMPATLTLTYLEP